MNLTNELIADSQIDLRQWLQDDLDGKERTQPTEAQRRAWRIEEIEQEIARLECERDELRKAE